METKLIRRGTSRSVARLLLCVGEPSAILGRQSILAVNWIKRHSSLALASIICASLAINLIVLVDHGVSLGGDSPRYIDGANRILFHLTLAGKQSSYTGYILFLAFLGYLHLSAFGVTIVQIGFAVITGIAVYELAKHLAGQMSGLLATVIFLFTPDIFRWNRFILTDALYIDFVILVCWSAWKASERGFWTKTLSFAVVIFASSIRPDGWLLPLITLSYWILLEFRHRQTKLFLIMALVFVFGFGVSHIRFFVTGTGNECPVCALNDNVIIWGYPHPFEGPHDPKSLGWRYLAISVVKNPGRAMKLAISRIAVEYSGVRQYYSPRHDVAILPFLLSIYTAASYGLYRHRRDPLVLLIAAIILYHTLIIAVFFADWDGRFLDHFLPLIGVLASSGAVLWVQQITRPWLGTLFSLAVGSGRSTHGIC